MLVLALETLGEEGIFVWSNDGISIVLVAIIGKRGDNRAPPMVTARALYARCRNMMDGGSFYF